MEDKKAMKKLNIDKQTALLAAALIVIVVGMGIVKPAFFRPTNIMNIFVQNSLLGIAALGAGLVMISGGIDLSIGYMISLSGCTAAVAMSAGASEPVGFLIGVLVGCACGLINGILVVVCKAEPFIITLGMMTVYQGLCLLVTRGSNINLSGFSFGREKIGGVVPVNLIVLVIVFIVVGLVFKFSKFGRRAYAIGDNEEAAYLTGIKVNRQKILMYLLEGFLMGFAAMFMLSRLRGCNSTMGEGTLMEAIAAAVIGGVSMSGGKGSVAGIFLGMLLIGVVNNSLNLLQVDSFWKYIIMGAIIVLAVFVSNIGKKSR